MSEQKKISRSAPSILSADLIVKGQIYSDGDVQLDGRLLGNISSHAVTIGSSAHVIGEVAGEIVTIKGTVDGTIRAKQVHLCTGSKINGDIYHEVLAIESGAELNGAVKREKDPLAEASVRSEQFSKSLPTQNTAN
ncbi:polymer-forming cytoskeletal protein [Alphaproteobacteria bacterium]|nr:polymer-forming cytoskeletal protein [Alphaproteobacteria bacterium]